MSVLIGILLVIATVAVCVLLAGKLVPFYVDYRDWRKEVNVELEELRRQSNDRFDALCKLCGSVPHID